MSLLPQQILPQTIPIGTVDPNTGNVTIDKNWWLLLYNLCENALGSSNNAPQSDNTQLIANTDTDITDTDATVLQLPIQNLAVQVETTQVSSSDLPDIARSLLLAQIALLPDPIPLAQPFLNVTPTGSIFSYTAPSAGAISVRSGNVSNINLTRQGATFATGITTGIIPVSRNDSIQVTYSSAPTITFIPGSPQ